MTETLYIARRAAIRMGADTSQLPRSAIHADEHASCSVCGFPGIEFERWVVESISDEYPSRFAVCDACVIAYRDLDWCTVTALRETSQ